jgi:hypothetical protein
MNRDEERRPRKLAPPEGLDARSRNADRFVHASKRLAMAIHPQQVVDGRLCAILPRGIPHGFRNVGETPGRFLCVVTPGGLEEYFLEVARCLPPPSPAQLAGMAKTYGLTLLPPGA